MNKGKDKIGCAQEMKNKNCVFCFVIPFACTIFAI